MLNKEVRTEKTLSDAALIALLTAAAGLVIAGAFLPDLDEWELAGLKFKRARASLPQKVADATIESAREDGRVAGDSVPLATAKDLLTESAAAALRAEDMLEQHRPRRTRRMRDRPASTEEHGYSPPALVDALLTRVARQAVADERATHRADRDAT